MKQTIKRIGIAVALVALLLVPAASHAISVMTNYRTFSREILTPDQMNALQTAYTNKLNEIIALTPGDSLKVVLVATDTLTTKASGKITVKDPLVSVSASDSLFFHLANIKRVNGDTIWLGTPLATPVFAGGGTAGKRWRFNLADIDSARIRDSLTVLPGAKTKFMAGSIFSAANLTADTTTVTGLLTADTLNVTGPTTLDTLVVNGPASLGADSSKLVLQDTTLALSGKRIILGSLHDPAFNCVNATWAGDHFECGGSFEKFRAMEKSTSYYRAARGDSGQVFPAEFWISIAAAADSVVIGDRTTGRIWMAFNNASSANLISYGAGSYLISDIAFVDGKLYASINGSSGNGIIWADFLADTGTNITTAGIYRYKGNIQSRNSALNYLLQNSVPSIVNVIASSVSAIRDPFGKRDALGRLAQWWMAGTDGGPSWYNPYTNAIYDGDTSPTIWTAFSPRGDAVWDLSAAIDYVFYSRSILRMTADNASMRDEFWDNGESGSEKLAWGNAAVFGRTAIIDRASWAGTNAPLIAVAADSGLVLLHAKANDNANGGQQLIEGGFNSGYMKGAVGAAYPLESGGTDVSPNAYSLTTIGGTHTYVNGVIGKADSLAGAASGWLVADKANLRVGTGDWTWSLWFKSINATGPAGLSVLMTNYPGAGGPYSNLYITPTTGYLYTTSVSTATNDIAPTARVWDGNWHFVVYQRAGSTEYLYLDGEPHGSVAVTHGAINNDSLMVGAISDGSSNFLGSIDNPIVTVGSALTPTEIRAMYQQGLSGLQNNIDPNDALPNNLAGTATDSVGYVQADQTTGHIIAGNQDSTVEFDRYGISIRKWGSPGGLIKDAALIPLGADSLGVAITTATKTGAYGRTQFIMPDVRVTDLAHHEYAFVQPAIGEQAVVDSSGIRGLFWTFNDATDAAWNANRRSIFGAKGTYPGFTAGQYGMRYEGESDSTTIIDGANASIGIAVTQDFNLFHNLGVKTTAGGTGGFDAINVANTATDNTFDHVRVLGADDDCANVDGPRTKFRSIDFRLCDDEGMDLQDESDHSIVTEGIIKDQSGDPITVFSTGESSIISNMQLEKYIIDGETSTKKSNNSEVSSW